MPRLPRSLLTLTALLLFVAAPRAGRPFVTEDAGLLDRGACEWESVLARSRVPDQPRASSAATQVGCGIGGKSQLAVNAGRARSGGERASSLGLAGKTGLWDGGEDGPALTLAWGSSWSKAGGNSRDWDGATALLALSQAFEGGWSVHANLGRSYERASRSSSNFWAVLAERQLSENFDAGVELFGAGSERPGLGPGRAVAAGRGLEC